MVDAGIVPTAIIGDLDSVDNTTLEHCKAKGTLVIHTPNQEQSDVAKGLHRQRKHIQMNRSISLASNLVATTTTFKIFCIV